MKAATIAQLGTVSSSSALRRNSVQSRLEATHTPWKERHEPRESRVLVCCLLAFPLRCNLSPNPDIVGANLIWASPYIYLFPNDYPSGTHYRFPLQWICLCLDFHLTINIIITSTTIATSPLHCPTWVPNR